MCEYIDKFTKVVVAVEGGEYGFKCWIFKKGLKADCQLQEKFGLEVMDKMNELLDNARTYMNREEELLVIMVPLVKATSMINSSRKKLIVGGITGSGGLNQDVLFTHL